MYCKMKLGNCILYSKTSFEFEFEDVKSKIIGCFADQGKGSWVVHKK